MPLFPRRDYVVGVHIQVDGYNSCPICGEKDLLKPTSSLKVDSFGKPFTYTTVDQQGILVDDGTFPTYGSWRCLINNHSFRTPSFSPKEPGFQPAQSGCVQAEF